MHRTMLIVAALVLTLASLLARVAGEPELTETPMRASQNPAPSTADSTADSAGPDATSRSSRTAVASDPRSPTRQKTFEEFVAQLVELGLEIWDAVESRSPADEVGSLNEAAKSLLLELRNVDTKCDQKALLRLTGLLIENESRRAKVERRVLQRVLHQGLEELARRAERSGDQSPLDQWVESLLVHVPQDEMLARTLGSELLVGSPWVTAFHEQAVLGITEQAVESPFLQEVASQLLLTLWQNLGRLGERRSERLSALALVFATAPNLAKRAAALEFLLLDRDGRYRDLVVQRVRESADPELAATLATSAALNLPPQDALDVVLRVHDLGQGRMAGAFVALGAAAPALMVEQYETRLADAAEPSVRAELLTALSASSGPEALDLGEVAFRQDPDRRVRQRALFLLSAHPDADVAERTLMSVMDDPTTAADPDWLGSVALALRNLTHARNALHRVGARLLTLEALLPGDRASLRSLLDEHLPSGR